MPSPKRWFPCSRDINEDPEVWELTETFGDRSLRIQLEVLAIIDRCENRWRLSGQWLASLSRKVRQQPATVRSVIGWMVARGWLMAEETAADGSPLVLSAPNFWKYHRRRDAEGRQSDANQGASMDSPLPNLPLTCRTKEEQCPPLTQSIGPDEEVRTKETADDLQREWNVQASRLTKCLSLTAARRKKAVLRLKEHPLSWWRETFQGANKIQFLRGDNDRGWKATFDWFIENEDNAIKCREGKYGPFPKLSAKTTPTSADQNPDGKHQAVTYVALAQAGLTDEKQRALSRIMRRPVDMEAAS